MSDLLINLAVSGSLSTAYLFAERVLQRHLRCKAVKPSSHPIAPDTLTTVLVSELRPALEEFIQTRSYETVGEQGPEFDPGALVEGEIWRRAGTLVRERFVVEKDALQEYRFIINFTSACQQGREIVQPYVVLLTKSLAYAISELEHQVAIHALGKNLTVVKRFQDPLDGTAVDRIRVDPTLNLHQGLEAAIELTEQEAVHPTISIYVVNGSSPIHDAKHEIKAESSLTSRAYVFQIGRPGLDQDLSFQGDYRPEWTAHLPRGFAKAYFVESVAGLKTTFTEFLQQARQYR